MRAFDWSGSSSQRRPQGSCKPPEPVDLSCEWIPALTPVTCKLRHGTRKDWIPHQTRIALNIEETIKRTHNSLTFAHGEWLVSVSLKHVRAGRKPA